MKKKCIILGCTGFIGQQFVRLLENHPKLDLVAVYASSRSAGKKMKDVWNLPYFHCPEIYSDLIISDMEDISQNVDIAFSGLPTSIAQEIEINLREKGVAVFSNASAHRMDKDVPILIPEINQEHLKLAKIQRENHGVQGFIITNANCSVTGAAMYLNELEKILPLNNAVISTYQALSGAGNKGLQMPNITNNVLPYINMEEEKMIIEAKKILGKLEDQGFIRDHDISLVTNCARVNVIDGHLEAITAFSQQSNTIEQDQIIKKLQDVKSPLPNTLYTGPNKHLIYLNEHDRPQPQLDAYYGESAQLSGMHLMVGRVRKNLHSISSYILVHNTVRGGSGGSILNAELAIHRNLI
ncbi:MAG: aspartate-semialdehyde dehydrogenase [Candidatus Heimdallarchaeota archaeon]|nr:aspartate-semialdehyde dehydrogenase [Candidatus Heimdallarchaeota archaeon]